jgi:hypothetical protein
VRAYGGVGRVVVEVGVVGDEAFARGGGDDGEACSVQGTGDGGELVARELTENDALVPVVFVVVLIGTYPINL